MKIDDVITFPANILGSEKYGSLIHVRNVYKELYNKTVWNKSQAGGTCLVQRLGSWWVLKMSDPIL